MAPQPNPRPSPRSAHPHFSGESAEKTEFVMQIKAEFSKLGIVMQKQMPAGTVMLITPADALDHLLEKNCHHKIIELVDAMERINELLSLATVSDLMDKVIKLQEKNKGKCGDHNHLY